MDPLSNCGDDDESHHYINPISFLNTLHQKMRLESAPVYNFTHDPVSGHFYCQVEFDGQVYQNQVASPKKKQAKEIAASMAMKDLSLRNPVLTKSIHDELTKAYASANHKKRNSQNSTHQPPHPRELIPKSVQWYEKQAEQANTTGLVKRPCVLLLEFCQMHRMPTPTYICRDDGHGYYLFDCNIGERSFTPELSFWLKNDAKDHVSAIAFNALYTEFCEKEKEEIYRNLHNDNTNNTNILLPDNNIISTATTSTSSSLSSSSPPLSSSLPSLSSLPVSSSSLTCHSAPVSLYQNDSKNYVDNDNDYDRGFLHSQ